MADRRLSLAPRWSSGPTGLPASCACYRPSAGHAAKWAPVIDRNGHAIRIVGAMQFADTTIDRLRKRRRRLLQAYLAHVGCLASTCAFAAVDATDVSVVTCLWLTLITVPPVLAYTVSVHKACRAIDPKSRTAGLGAVVLATIFLTPFESGLLLPAKNLWVARSILRLWERTLTRPSTRAAKTHACDGRCPDGPRNTHSQRRA